MKENLRNTPWQLPQGYADSLKTRLESIPARSLFLQRLRPYMAVAAAVLVTIACGTALMRLSVRGDNVRVSEFEKYQYADLIPITAGYYLEDYEGEESLTEEDIVQYLIDTQIPIEYISYEAEH